MKTIRALFIAVFAVAAGSVAVHAAEPTPSKTEAPAQDRNATGPLQCARICSQAYRNCIANGNSSDVCDEVFNECDDACLNAGR